MSTVAKHKILILSIVGLLAAVCLFLIIQYGLRPSPIVKQPVSSAVQINSRTMHSIQDIALPTGYKVQDIKTSEEQLLILSRQADPEEEPETLYITLIDTGKDTNGVINVKITETN